MATVTQSAFSGEAVLSPGNGDISFEQVTIGTALDLAPNTVLGLITATDKYVLHDAAAGDGSENAVAVLVYAADAAAADVQATIVARMCTVSESELVWKSGIIAGDKTAGLASLATKLIIGRSE